MASLDYVCDLCEVLKKQGFKYAIVTLQKGQFEDGSHSTNVDYFMHLPTKKDRQIVSSVFPQIMEELEEQSQLKPQKKKK